MENWIRAIPLVIGLSLAGCASTLPKGAAGLAQADAAVIIAEALDEMAGCPLDLTRRFGQELSKQANCPDPR